MVRNHLKRIAAPKTWQIQRKQNVYVARPSAGKRIDLCLPLSVILTEKTGFCQSKREVMVLLHEKQVTINGTICHDKNFPVGIFDVVRIGAKKAFRLVLDLKGRLTVIEAKESTKTLAKVVNKTNMPGGKMQLNCLNGANVKLDDLKLDAKHAPKVGDVIVMEDKKPAKVLKLEAGAQCLLISGSHGGAIGIIESINDKIITVKNEEGSFNTLKSYAFVIGKEIAVR